MDATLDGKTERKMDDICGDSGGDDDDCDDGGDWWWFHGIGTEALFLFIAMFALLVRVLVSLGSYSGAGNPPRFGDYEAQRHWMEITINIPPLEWYTNSTHNDLSYWGLDYPPLTAYQSYVHGILLRHFDPDSVLLFSSRGHESYFGKFLMRWMVLSSDILLFFPSVFYFIFAYYKKAVGVQRNDMAWHIAVILLNPCLILIDHGHFQFNCISLGLTVGAVGAILSGKDIIASILYCLALNHKQMSAYYAPAFFSYLLGKSLRQKNPFFKVMKLSLVVVGTFILVWWPYLHSLDSILAVIRRLAPFERGIYEDYVANFWCTTSVVIKWKALFTTEWLKIISLCATIAAFMPSLILQILSPTTDGFLYALLNTSFSFYFFSFQVHEKSSVAPTGSKPSRQRRAVSPHVANILLHALRLPSPLPGHPSPRICCSSPPIRPPPPQEVAFVGRPLGGGTCRPPLRPSCMLRVRHPALPLPLPLRRVDHDPLFFPVPPPLLLLQFRAVAVEGTRLP